MIDLGRIVEIGRYREKRTGQFFTFYTWGGTLNLQNRRPPFRLCKDKRIFVNRDVFNLEFEPA